MKYWLALVAPNLLLGAVSAIPSECLETQTLPVITTTASALVLTDLMPGTTSAPGSGSYGQPNPDNTSSIDAGAHQTNVAGPAGSQPSASGVSPGSGSGSGSDSGSDSGSGSGSGHGSDSASTPLPSDNPAHVSGASNPTSNFGKAVFVATSIALVAQIFNWI